MSPMSEVYRGAWVVAYRELLRFVQDRPRVVSSLTFPLLFLAFFGAGFSNVVGAMAGGVDLLQFRARQGGRRDRGRAAPGAGAAGGCAVRRRWHRR
jgi:hypothetical protein